jgi:MYXO-CTERM domain-containing protein
MPNRRSPTLAVALAFALGLTAATSRAADDGKAQVLLRTATSLAYLAPNGANAVEKNTGAGVMDAKPAFRNLPLGNGSTVTRIGTLFTVEDPQANNAGSHMQGGLYIGDLTEQGLAHKAVRMLPRLDGERAFMRPLIAFGQTMNYMLLIGASEDNGNDNGNNNGNPQAVAFVADLDGNILPIGNNTRGAGNAQAKPTNLVQLSGAQDNQQYGPHSICYLGSEGPQSESFLVGVQRDNKNAYIMKVVVQPAAGGANVTVPYFKKVLDNARHCRPQVTCPAAGSPFAYLTTVEGNNQPAEVGVRLFAINPSTGDVANQALIAPSDPDGTKFPNAQTGQPGPAIYAVQNSGLIPLGNGLAAVGYQVSSHGRKDQGDGHSGGANMSVLATIRLSDLGVVDRKPMVAPYQRHAFSFPMLFGPGIGKPAAAVMGGSSTGTGKGRLQIVEIDGMGKVGDIANLPTLDVSLYSDVANLPARAKRNPNNQGAGFLNGISGAPNPGYGKVNGFLPEVRTFFVSALPGYAMDPIQHPETNRESLWVSLVPATWDEKVDAVPGPVTKAEDIKPGPSPVVKPGGQVIQPTQLPDGGFFFDAGAPAGPHFKGGDPEGCGCSTPGRTSGGRATLAGLLGIGLALALRRQRRREASLPPGGGPKS